jgi:hypothetical protein
MAAKGTRWPGRLAARDEVIAAHLVRYLWRWSSAHQAPVPQAAMDTRRLVCARRAGLSKLVVVDGPPASLLN